MRDHEYWRKLSLEDRKVFTLQKASTKVINTATGEDITEKYQLTPKKFIFTHQVNFRKRTDDLAAYVAEQGGFIFTFYKLQSYLGKELKQADLARLLFLATYISYEKNKLVHDNGKHIDKKGMKALLGLQTRAFQTFYKTVTELNIIVEEGKRLYMNAEYFYKGDLPKKYTNGDRTYTRTFIDSVRELYKQYGTTRKASQLGLLYLVIPFIHYSTNILVSNPNEEDINELDALSLEELAKALGYDKNKIARSLKSVSLGERFVFMITDMGRNHEKHVIVHPAIFWRGNFVPDLLTIFDVLSQTTKKKEIKI